MVFLTEERDAGVQEPKAARICGAEYGSRGNCANKDFTNLHSGLVRLGLDIISEYSKSPTYE